MRLFLILFTTLLVSGKVSVRSPKPLPDPEVITARQATKASLMRRLALEPRQAGASVACTASCCCPDGTTCPDNCVAECAGNTPSRKRSLLRELHSQSFTGSVLAARDAASLFLGRGQFTHTNGTFLRDDAYIAEVPARESGFGLADFASVALRVSSSLATSYYINGLARKDPDEVLVFSQNFAARVGDLLPMVSHLLDDESFEQIFVFGMKIPRDVLENILHGGCPKLGPEMCPEHLLS